MLSLFACFVFGLLILLNTFTLGDGMWFWYAQIFLHGKKLYSQTHLALQPLYILETAAAQRIFGVGWLVSRLQAVLHLALYLFGLVLLIRRLTWSDGQKAVMLGCVFLVSIYFNAYRFDDYHVMADCFQLFSLLSLIELYATDARKTILRLVSVVGVLCGLSITTRINDGGILFITALVAAFAIARRNKLLAVVVLSAAAGATVLLVVKLTGDTFHDYLYSSLFHAAANKGGAGSVLAAPLRLPLQTLIDLRHNWRPSVCAVYAVILTALAGWTFMVDRRAEEKLFRRRAFISAGFFILTGPFFAFQFWNGGPTLGISGFITVGLLVTGFIVLARLVLTWTGKSVRGWSPLETLLFIPSGQLASGTMSSGGTFMGLYMPIIVFFLLWHLVTPWRARTRWQVASALTLALCAGLPVIPYKVMVPFDWHNYHERLMLHNRVWYHHPQYGWMYIQRPTLELARGICDQIDASPNPHTLLTSPLPFFNYFCAIPPWHDTVQTFFDTSGREGIDQVLTGLASDPPQWIVYQRQLSRLREHEIRYNHGGPLPHRELDNFLMSQVASGRWQVAFDQGDPDTVEWIAIRTGR